MLGVSRILFECAAPVCLSANRRSKLEPHLRARVHHRTGFYTGQFPTRLSLVGDSPHAHL